MARYLTPRSNEWVQPVRKDYKIQPIDRNDASMERRMNKPRYRWWMAQNGVWIWAYVPDLANTGPGSIIRYMPAGFAYWYFV